jgi:uncharacterized protein
MRIITLEEHFLIPSLIESVDDSKLDVLWMTPELRDELADLGDRRLKAMDASGITMQVLSATMPGADLLDGEEGIRFARSINDRLAEAVKSAYPSISDKQRSSWNVRFVPEGDIAPH